MDKVVYGITLPEIFLAAIKSQHWPRGRVRSSPFVAAAPFLTGMDLEFVQSVDALLENEIADTKTLLTFADDPRLAERSKLRRGSVGGQPIALPWLDVDKAIVFGGGADYGDDLWLVLDFRSDPNDPRVIANEYLRAGDAGPPECFWREVAPCFSVFCASLGIISKKGGDGV